MTARTAWRASRAPGLAMVLAIGIIGSAPTPVQAEEATRQLRPTIFTQVHSGRIQSITAGDRFEVQLPGTPAIWRRVPDSESPNIEFHLMKLYPSPDRIPGTSTIQAFEYRVTAPGPVTLRLKSDPPAPLPKGGRFTLLLQAD